MSGKSVRRLAFLAGVLGVMMPVRATVVVSNLAEGSDQRVFSLGTVLYGSAFTLDSTFAPTQLASVQLRMSVSSVVNPVPVTLKLYSDAGDNPGTPLLDLGTVNVASMSPLNYSFTPQSPLTLQPSSQYWVVVSKGAGLGIALNWHYSEAGSRDPAGDPAASIRPGTASGPYSTGWYYFKSPGKFKIEGEPVPEPASVMLLAVGALALRGRRKICR